MSPQSHLDRAHIYLSFADEDRARAMELVRWLNDAGWHIVADERHAFASDASRPSRHLDDCDVVLCVVTAGWLVSSDCEREMSYCTARGKRILPVICEQGTAGLLPAVLDALPRIDLTRNGVIDYLRLMKTLTRVSRAAGRDVSPMPRTGVRRAWRRLRAAWTAVAAWRRPQ
jgi:TIR domain